MDNTLKRAITQFQANKERCGCILFPYSFINQSKDYRLNLDPKKIMSMIPILIQMFRRSSQVSTKEGSGGTYIIVP